MKITPIFFALWLFVVAPFSCAGDEAILTVTGNIEKSNQADKKTFVFSFEDLKKLPNTVVQTKTIWTGDAKFQGPTMRDVLAAVGANKNAKEVEIKTLDNYPVSIPIDDFKRWEVILAHTQDGNRLKVATKGPLWVIYPVDKYKSELDNNATRTKFAWSVKGFVVR